MTAAYSIALTLAIALVATACTSQRPSVAPISIAPDAIKVSASEYRFEPAILTAKGGEVSFAVTNTGTVVHEFEVFQGDKVVDEIEGITPGLTRQLTVTLAPGAYTNLCMLDGHDLAGMKGTLTVTAD